MGSGPTEDARRESARVMLQIVADARVIFFNNYGKWFTEEMGLKKEKKVPMQVFNDQVLLASIIQLHVHVLETIFNCAI